MLPSSEPQIRRLVVFTESDWQLLGEVFDEREFRASIIGVLAHGYCDWLRAKGIANREDRNAKLSIEECIEYAHSLSPTATPSQPELPLQ